MDTPRISLLGILLMGLLACAGGGGESSPHGSGLDSTLVDVHRLSVFSSPESVIGELVYVPLYSSIYHRSGDRDHLLTSTLSVHNVDLTSAIEISSVSYFDTEGGWVRELLPEPRLLGPLATQQLVIPQADRTGGSGSNVLVKWESSREVPRPMIEAVMVSTSSQQGISFLTQGQVVRELVRSLSPVGAPRDH